MDAAKAGSVTSANAILRSLRARIAVLDPHGVIVEVNDAWRNFARGHGAESTGGRGASYLHVCDQAAKEGDEIARAAADGIRAVLQGETPEFTLEYPCATQWFLMSVTPLPADERGTVVMHHDITKRKNAEIALQESEERLRQSNQALRRSEERLRLALTAAQAGVWAAVPGQAELYWSPEYRHLYGFQPDEPCSLQTWAERVHPDDLEQVRRKFSELETGRAEEVDQEFRIVNPERGTRWVLEFVRAHREPSGRVRRLIGVDLDITERKLAQNRETMLAKEAEHRARNVLTVVLAVLKLTRAETKEEYVAAVRSRIAALARAHNLLVASGWTGANLRELVTKELEPFVGGNAERLTVSGPAVQITATSVQPLAMILHELATNAAKHGALSRHAGRIVVAWSVGSDGRLRIDWSERGGPSVRVPERRGFGSEIVTRAALDQLRGEVRCNWSAAGLQLLLTVAKDCFEAEDAGSTAPNANEP